MSGMNWCSCMLPGARVPSKSYAMAAIGLEFLGMLVLEIKWSAECHTRWWHRARQGGKPYAAGSSGGVLSHVMAMGCVSGHREVRFHSPDTGPEGRVGQELPWTQRAGTASRWRTTAAVRVRVRACEAFGRPTLVLGQRDLRGRASCCRLRAAHYEDRRTRIAKGGVTPPGGCRASPMKSDTAGRASSRVRHMLRSISSHTGRREETRNARCHSSRRRSPSTGSSGLPAAMAEQRSMCAARRDRCDRCRDAARVGQAPCQRYPPIGAVTNRLIYQRDMDPRSRTSGVGTSPCGATGRPLRSHRIARVTSARRRPHHLRQVGARFGQPVVPNGLPLSKTYSTPPATRT